MRLDSSQLKQHLTQNLSPLYVLVGDEPLAQSECLDALRLAARKAGADERTGFIVERNFNWQQISQFAQACHCFHRNVFSKFTFQTANLAWMAAKHWLSWQLTLIPDTTIIITLPELEREAKNSAWFNALQSASTLIELKEVAPNQLPQWLAARLQAQNQSTDAATLAFIAHQVEGNLLAAHQEVQKLGLLYPAGEISADAVRESVLNVSRYDAFQLGEAVLAGDAERTTRILQGLQDEGENGGRHYEPA